MRQKIEAILPHTVIKKIKAVRDFIVMIKCFSYDFFRFMKYSGNFDRSNIATKESWLLQYTHTVLKKV